MHHLGRPDNRPTAARRLAAYALGLASVGVALLLTRLTWPVLEHSESLLFVAAVLLTTRWGGLGPGLAAVLLSVLVLDVFLLEPAYSVTAGAADLLKLGIFAALVLLIASLMDARRHAEEAGRREGTWLRATLGSLGDAVITTDVDGRIVTLNPVAEALTGWPRPEAVGRPIREVFRRQSGAGPSGDSVERILTSPTPGALAEETTLVARDGRPIPIEVRVATIRDGPGPRLGAVLVFRDLTERRRAEQALRAGEERFALALRASPLIVFHQDRDLRYRWVHDVERAGGAEPVLGRTDEELLGPEEARPLTAIKRQVIETGAGLRREVRMTLDGRPRYFDLLVEPQRDPDGRVSGVACAALDITDRVRTDAALRDAYARLDSVLSSITDGYIALDDRFRFLEVNPAARRLVFDDLPLEAMLGRDFWEVFPQGRSSDFFAEYHRAVREGVPVHFEARSHIVDRWFETHAYPRGGRLEIYVRDITDRKKAEEARREALDRLSTLFDASPLALAVVDPDGRVQLWNPAAERIFGWRRDEVLGRELPTVGATQRAEFRANLRRVLEEGPIAGMEVRRLRKGGEPFDAMLWAVPLRDADGRPAAALAMLDDVTERKRAAERVRRSEEQLRAALRAAHMVAWSFDPAADRMTRSENVREVFGLEPGFTAEEGWDLVHPDDRDGHRAEVAAALAEGRAYKSEFRHLHPATGEVRWFEDHGRGEFDDAGRLARVSGVILDVSERKRAELALRESDRRKGEFLAMLAHELRNPLAAIAGAVQVARADGRDEPEGEAGGDAPDGDARAWALGVVARQSAQLTRLVDDLLDLSRLSQGKIPLRPEPVDLADVVRRAVESGRPLIESRGHAMSVELPAAPLLLEADAARLEQVVVNLLANAARYTEPGGRIAVRARRHADRAEVAVSDTGVGLAPEAIPRIFEMFAQVDSALDRVGGGLGIGLALVRTLVQLHGGTIEARSEGLGRGSTFLVSLPIRPPSAPAAPRPARHPRPRARAGRRVLIVDDNQDAARALARLLRLRGHEVREVFAGLGVVDAARDFRPDAVLLDIGLPDLDGYQVARRLRAEPDLGPLLLVAVSGFGQDRDRLRSREAGFDAHLVKPVSIPDLASVLEPTDRSSPVTA